MRNLRYIPTLKKRNIPTKSRYTRIDIAKLIEKKNEILKNTEINQNSDVGTELAKLSFPDLDSSEIISNERIIRLSDYGYQTTFSKFKIKLLSNINSFRILKCGDIVCVRTNLLHDFSKILNRLTFPIILVSNYADLTVDNSFLYIANHRNIFHWFAINCIIDHPKITKVPLGLGASHNFYGNIGIFSTVFERKKENPKKKLMVNYKVDRLRPARGPVSLCLNNQGLVNSYGMSIEQYWKSICEHEFILSPPGCGIDCYRIWETLYLGRIPVVIKNSAFNQFEDLPILFLDDYNDIFTKLKISDEWKTKEFKWDIIKYSYWKNLFNIKKRECIDFYLPINNLGDKTNNQLILKPFVL